MKFEIENGILKKYTEEWYGVDDGKEVVLPAEVKAIEDKAFYHTRISSIILPDGLISIGKSAFDYCENLKKVVFPKTIRNIGEYAFSGCRKLEEVYVDDIATWLNISFEDESSNPLYAGRSCKLLVDGKEIEELTIPKGFEIINNWTFSNCNSIKKIIIPEGVIELGKGAFHSCDNLTEITLPSTLRKIGMFALRSYHLKRINIKSLETWLQLPFSQKESNYPFDFSFSRDLKNEACLYIDGELLQRLVVPQGTHEISELRFQGLTCLQEVVIPEGVTTIGKLAFAGCHFLQSVIIPDTVTYIGQAAFEACLLLKQIRLPQTLLSISDNLFSGCSSIETITIPSHVNEIGVNAFSGCKFLRSIMLPNSIKRIGKSAFKSSGLTMIDLPEGIESIEEETFSLCFSFAKINLPTSLKQIGRSAFQSCKITEVHIKSVSQWISIEFAGGDSNPLGGSHGTIFRRSGGRLIIDNKDYTSLSLPAGVSEIGDYLFSGCAGFKELIIPEGIKSIGNNSFSGCPNIERIVLPSTIQTISEYAFSYCPNLKSISIPKGITSISSSVFLGCNSLEDVMLPPTLETIGNQAFYACTALKNIEIPQSTKKICKNAFCKSGLKTLTIEDGVKVIEEDSFLECQQLEEVYISGTVSNISSTAFSQCSALSKVVIHCRFDAISKDAFSKSSSIKEVYINDDQFEIARDYFLKKVRFYTIDGIKLGKPDKATGGGSTKKPVITKSKKEEKGGNEMETKVIYQGGITASHVSDPILYAKGKPKGFIKPEVKEATVILDGKEFSAVFKITSKLPAIWKRFYAEKDNGGIYDPHVALKAAQQSGGYIDDSTGSYVSCPLYGQIPESTEALKPEDVESRLKTFVLIANQCVEEETLLKIARALPKKKNGMLHKGRLQHITYLDLVDYDGSTFEIVAKNEDDSQFCVEIRSNVPVVSDLFYQSYLL